ncbi:class II glutamine amidotransferase [Amycolatopsis echigonensis]|uniref:Glutamine amidotransferase n=1 Tax=Amycolatopsis echigonensis TaxID=2576905 RepID=A0A2N3WMZ6_9PSEU|nr:MULTISPECIES: class II glutamine amidotransferase [Amycolatopsis]MBB2504844.1 class II glutamine amidotransferase [Amycolatopsis echigonensis]PKV95238.1 glutamine amidotransferase [Amycolatopsis niigatensis]
MCRLFGLSAAPRRVHARFWLLEAPDSLAAQSRREPDGTGLGVFDAAGSPEVWKQPLAAYADKKFACEAKECASTTFLAHIRYASTGGLDPANTHPFLQHGRLFAHNGVLGDLPRLEDRLGEYRDLVQGDTDSERFFALVTQEIDAHHGDVSAGITAAARWAAANLPVFAINLVLTTADELWALRYPDTHDLYVLQRGAGGPHGDRHLEHASAAGRIRARSSGLARHRSVVVASERMDEDPGWQNLRPGELLHVGADLTATRRIVLEQPPRHALTLDDLGAHAAASQQAQ